jgi:hypothetical protein
MTKSDVATELAAERLFVFFPGYSAPKDEEPFRDGGPLSNQLVRNLAAWRGPNMRGHVRVYRDFYANPRTPAYMATLAGEIVARSRIGQVTALIDSAVTVAQADAPWTNNIRVVERPLRDATLDDLGISPQPGDAVLLLHSDPLGMGLGTLERQLTKVFPGRVFILNGRRRGYRLDQRMSRILRCHRIIAETRIVEALLARLFGAVAAVLAFGDRIIGRSQTR